jgi:hypothetical protein
MIMNMLVSMLQSDSRAGDWVDNVIRMVDSPLPFSPLSEYLLLLFVLWLLSLRRKRAPSFDRQAQEVLDEKFEEGELSEKSYRKYQQDLSLRPKR